jgi:hypothetical protein
MRVLVSLRGKVVTLEHHVDGKPSGRKDQSENVTSWKIDALADPDGKTRYQITGVTLFGEPNAPHALMVDVNIEGAVSYPQHVAISNLTADPAQAPVAHLHGPLTVQADTVQNEGKLHFAAFHRDQPTDLRAMIGTGDPKKGCYVVVGTSTNGPKPVLFKDAHPTVDIEFPPLKAGAAPVKQRYPLNQFC